MTKEPKKTGLDLIDMRMLEFLATHPRATLADIAKAVGLSTRQICRRRDRKEFQEVWKSLSATIEDEIKALQREAVAELRDLLKKIGRAHV